MNYGDVRNPKTKEGRLFRVLRKRLGQWCSSYELAGAIETTSIATHVSGVRLQLEGSRFFRLESKKIGRKHYVRVVRRVRADKDGQMRMAV